MDRKTKKKLIKLSKKYNIDYKYVLRIHVCTGIVKMTERSLKIIKENDINIEEYLIISETIKRRTQGLTILKK